MGVIWWGVGVGAPQVWWEGGDIRRGNIFNIFKAIEENNEIDGKTHTRTRYETNPISRIVYKALVKTVKKDVYKKNLPAGGLKLARNTSGGK